MPGRKRQLVGASLATGAGSCLLALAAMMNSAFAYGQTFPEPTLPTPLVDPSPATTVVMGATGLPDPTTNTSYLQTAQAFIDGFLPGSRLQVLVTPEDFAPLTGVNSLTYDQSVSRGLTDLDNAIASELTNNTPIGIYGVSQSADIASLLMTKLDPSGTPSSLALSFILVGSEMNPNGGLFERFVGAELKPLGLTFSGATPDDDFPTVVYTHEYDGFADFPRYPLDLLSDINAAFGIAFDHNYTAAMIPTAFELPTCGPTETSYYLIPTPDLPMLEPLRLIPVIGNPITDLIQPDMAYLVNLGFGNPLDGWSTGPANMPTQFGLLPSASAFDRLPVLLYRGAVQGWENFVGDVTGTGPNPEKLPALTALLNPSSGLVTDAAADPGHPANVSDLAQILQQFTQAALAGLPEYDLALFHENLSNPIDAIGLPIAADMGLGSVIVALEALSVAEAAGLIE